MFLFKALRDHADPKPYVGVNTHLVHSLILLCQTGKSFFNGSLGALWTPSFYFPRTPIAPPS
jgi:hypothetical protein